MAKNYERTREYRELKQSVTAELEALGKVGAVYTDLVDEYMGLWLQRQLFRDDLDERGVVVLDEKRGQFVENRSASLRLQTDKQMQALLAELLKPDPSRPVTMEDDDL